ncbi:MAG: PGPGW domain-containing protein [Pseudomonadota bacterium]
MEIIPAVGEWSVRLAGMECTVKLLRHRLRISRLLLGIATLVLGMVLVPLPVPLGWLFLLLGMALITNEVIWLRRVVAWFRSKLPWADRLLRRFYPLSPVLVRDFIDATDPTATGRSD